MGAVGDNGRVRAVLASPVRLVAFGLVALVGLGLAWYLGSPLFVRTTLNEGLPVAAAVVSASPTRGAPVLVATSAPAPQTVATGELGFVDTIHNGKGKVRLLRTGDGLFLRFEDVAITNAPDVHVYLSPETGGKWTEATSLYLGPLRATNGSFNYAVPVGTDVPKYRSVVVWCRQFAVLITWADLR